MCVTDLASVEYFFDSYDPPSTPSIKIKHRNRKDEDLLTPSFDCSKSSLKGPVGLLSGTEQDEGCSEIREVRNDLRTFMFFFFFFSSVCCSVVALLQTVVIFLP